MPWNVERNVESRVVTDVTERRQTKTNRSRYVSKACNECKRRKVKCDGQEPCNKCGTQGFECSYRARRRCNNLQDGRQITTEKGVRPDLKIGDCDTLDTASELISDTGPATSGLASGVAQRDPLVAGLNHAARATVIEEDGSTKMRRVRRKHKKVKSCTQCRQQKLKCDAPQRAPRTPCSRCSKRGLDCVITTDWERVNPRTKAQLARENEELRRRLNQRLLEVDRRNDSPQTSDTQVRLEDGPLPQSPDILPAHERSGPNLSYHALVPGDMCLPLDTLGMIDGLPMSSTNSCLQIFFKKYAQMLSGLFPHETSYLSYHDRSPFLFWTMACTGARHFHDAEYFRRAAHKVRELIGTHLLQIQDPIPTIQAILILCLWPLPIDSMWKDPSHALAGAAMQLAIQNGLHKVRHERDFRKTYVHTNDVVTHFRARLWLHCVIAFQRTSICDGIPFSAVLGSGSVETESSLGLVDNRYLVSRYKMHLVQIRAIAAITQNHNLQEPKDCRGISALINVFDTQIQEIDASNGNNVTLHLASKFVRLSLLVFHLFSDESEIMMPGAMSLFKVCIDILDLATGLDITQSLAWHASHYHLRMILLAAFCVLRIMRSRLREMIVINDAEQSLFKAINFVKNRSTEPFDVDARYAIILKQLYSSSTAFRREDGEIDGLHLRIRSRLFMSIAFDSFWWWRTEFDGRCSPHRSPEAPVISEDYTAAVEEDVFNEKLDINAAFDPDLNSISTSLDFENWHWPAGLTFEDGHMPLPALY